MDKDSEKGGWEGGRNPERDSGEQRHRVTEMHRDGATETERQGSERCREKLEAY